MKTISSSSQHQDDQIASTIDSLIFGHLQRKQYYKTLNALLSESPHLAKYATTVPNAPNHFVLNVNCFLHDQNLEQIIHKVYNYGQFLASPKLLDLGKKLRDLTNEFETELYDCRSYSNNEQRFDGEEGRVRPPQNQAVLNDQMLFVNQQDVGMRSAYNLQRSSQSVNEGTRNDGTGLQFSQAMESDGGREENPHDNNQHNRQKAVRPLQQSQEVMQFVGDVGNLSNEMLDKEAGIDNTSSVIDPFLDIDFNFVAEVAEGETLFETLESVERAEAMAADQNSRNSMNRSGEIGSLALDIPMHYDIPPSTSSIISSLHPSSSSQQPHSGYTMPPHSHSNSNADPTPMCGLMARPLMEQYMERPSIVNAIENLTNSQNGTLNSFPRDCTMTENVEEQPLKKETNKSEKKRSRDDLFEDTSVKEGNIEWEYNPLQENRRGLEMKELQKKRDRDQRRIDKDKKEDERRDRSKEDRHQKDKRSFDGRKKESSSRDEKNDREERKRREQEEQKKIIDAQKRQMKAEERALQKKKEDENRKRELKEKDDEKRREKEKVIKKVEDERRNELEGRRRKEALLRKSNEKDQQTAERMIGKWTASQFQEALKLIPNDPKMVEDLAKKITYEYFTQVVRKKKGIHHRHSSTGSEADSTEDSRRGEDGTKTEDGQRGRTEDGQRGRTGEGRRMGRGMEEEQSEKQQPPPLLIGDSPLDKIAALMDGKELKNELEHHRSSVLNGSRHSSPSVTSQGKAQEQEPPITDNKSPSVLPILPKRLLMPAMKQPRSVFWLDDSEEDDEDEEEKDKDDEYYPSLPSFAAAAASSEESDI